MAANVYVYEQGTVHVKLLGLVGLLFSAVCCVPLGGLTDVIGSFRCAFLSAD